MCGRFLLSLDLEELIERYRIFKGYQSNNIKEDEIFPSNYAPVVIAGEERELVMLKWGFKPSWSKRLIINARGETVDKKSLFRGPLIRKRCIIPATSFFEWKKDGGKSKKYRIFDSSQRIFSMAGIYDTFKDEDGADFSAFTILTTTPSPVVAKIHNRMPVIIPAEDEETWLSPSNRAESIGFLIRPYDMEGTVLRAVPAQ